MSASLVGSEMCIRDSPCIDGRSASARTRRLRERERPCPGRESPQGKHCPCLLYTSDAADDM
eukprot:5988966-Alexandrium_andersonii.AAC.1